MKNKKTVYLILILAVLCCSLMALVDGVLRPGYLVKSMVKLAVFLLVPIGAQIFCSDFSLKSLFRFRKQGMILAISLGGGIYIFLVLGYFLISQFVDFSGIVSVLAQNAGVTKDNFLSISLYISFINSLLEEFFFRGFLFLQLKGLWNRKWAYMFSALAFSLYHCAMMIGWFSWWMFGLILLGLFAAGLLFDLLDDKQETIYTSWLPHMFANFAINTIGFILMN